MDPKDGMSYGYRGRDIFRVGETHSSQFVGLEEISIEGSILGAWYAQAKKCISRYRTGV
jgi:hypothetical protein